MRTSFRLNLLIAATTALLSAAALFLIWEGRADRQQDWETGEMLAELAARASVDGLIAEDRIELGVVANRLAGVPGVAGVAIITVEDELLALSGTLEAGTPFVHPIVLDDTLLGLARISLEPRTAALDWIQVATSVVALLAVALLVAWWSTRIGGHAAQPAEDAATEPDPPPQAATRYLLIGNLHNQLTLTGSERKRVVERALAIARRVGEIYGSRSSYLPGKGLLTTFSAQGGNDPAFKVVCAAFLTAECLAGELSTSHYRFGLHAIELQAGKRLSDHPEALEDAVLLAAMGKSGAIVASESFFTRLHDPDLLEAESLSHPMLEQLHGSPKRGYLITGLESSRRALLDRQASHLVNEFRTG